MQTAAEPSRLPLEVLVAEEDADLRALFARGLRRAGHSVRTTADGAAARALLEGHAFDVLICDVRLPRVDGLTLLREVRESGATTDTILVTGTGTVKDAVSALRRGARDYIVKPVTCDELVLQLDRIGEERTLRRELAQARARLSAHREQPRFVGVSHAAVELRERIDMMAKSDAPVCILGESGTGKELVARLLHERSERRGKPFVAVNCAALPETLLEAELFGHLRGAFTGATRQRDGRFRAAHGGTLLLDEVADMSPPAQAKLLRVLEEGVVQPLGTNTSTRIDVRVLAATHRDLKERIAAGLFREDLYYRLNVLRLLIPPLRDRPTDLPVLVAHVLERLTPGSIAGPTIHPAAWAALRAYPFPGNVRELAHALEHAFVLSGGAEIELRHLPEEIATARESSMRTAAADATLPLAAALAEFEREYLLRALRAADGNRTRAARALGISRKSLWERLRRHRLARELSTAA